MRKFLIAIIFVGSIASGVTYVSNGQFSPQVVTAQAVEQVTSVAVSISPGKVYTYVSPTPEPSPPIEPDIPTIVDTLYFGVPVGNGHRPQKVAVDSQRRRLYTLNEGLSSAEQGNTISVINLDSGEISDLLTLNKMSEKVTFQPTPLDLLIDPYRSRLYALSGDRFANSSTANTLTIIDTDKLEIRDTLPGVEAVAPGPDRLYLANDTRLWAVDPDTLAELAGGELEPRQFNEPLRLDVEANRLYLGRGRPWSVDIFTADTLEPVDSFAVTGDLAELILDSANQRLLLVSGENDGAVLSVLDLNGQPLDALPPVLLESFVYSVLPLVLTDQTLYLADNTPDYTYELKLLDRPDLTIRRRLPLPSRPNDLTVDPVTGLLYAAYSFPDSYVLVIDPATGDTQFIFTALHVADALADPEAERLYVLNNSGTLQVLSLSNYRLLDSVETGLRTTFNSLNYAGQLSLDRGRERLYLSGDPVRTVETDSLKVTTHADLVGQLTPDPTTDRVYLHSPCRCREEQCNILILAAGTLTGTQTIFPPEDPFTAPCVFRTNLDSENQLLYASINNGIPGSNSGYYFTVFDVQPPSPEQIFTDGQISYGALALDSVRQRAFAPRYRINRSFLHRFDVEEGQSITQTIELVGAQGQLVYDPTYDRLYAVSENALQVFNGDLALLAEITLQAGPQNEAWPAEFWPLTFDPPGQRIYLGNDDGQILVVATGGGQLEPPPLPAPLGDQIAPQQLLVAPDGTTRFHVNEWRLYRSRDEGQTWQLLGAGLPGRMVNDLAISPDYARDQTLWAGLWNFGRGGGLYRSTDGGDTWLPSTRGLTDLEIQQIAISPTSVQDQTIFLTTLDRGLFRSTDGGGTWAHLGDRYAADSAEQKLLQLAVSSNFVEDGLVIIGHHNLLRSTDGGETWTDTGLPPGVVAFSPDFARDGLILSDGRWRSTDGGETWQPAAAGLEAGVVTQNIFFSPDFAVDRIVYILQQPDFGSSRGLQRSVDAGQTWQSLLGGLPDGFELAAATILPTGELYLSDSEGQLLTVSPETLAWGRQPVDLTQLDLQDVAIGPDGALFVANSTAGVFKSTDGGRTWQDTEFPARAIEIKPARLASAEDGTIFAAAGAAIERTRGADRGESWTYLSDVPTGFTVASLAVSPNFEADGVVLAGGDYRQNQLLRSVDGGDTWQVVFDGALLEGTSDISLITFSPNFADDGEIYAWLQQGGLLHSTDRGLNWTLADGEQSTYTAQSLAVSPGGDKLYLGALYGHLLVSTDKGQTWLDLKDRIPGDRVWSSAIALTDDGAILLGTDIGAYRSLDEGQTWREASSGLALNLTYNTPQAVRALRFEGDQLYAALREGGLYVTEDRGRSWWSTAADAPASAVPAPTPTVTATPIPQPSISPAECPGLPLYFADLWAERSAQLGCPTEAHQVKMAEQLFEGGRMFWRSDTSAIYVLPTDQSYGRFEDTWDDSQPIYACPNLGPSQTPPTPQRGFGKVWCNQAGVRELLGNATGQEVLLDATVQEFENGLIFGLDGGGINILEDQTNGWMQVE